MPKILTRDQRIKSEVQYRTFVLDRAKADKDARTIELAFSSETPVSRWWGTEILSHEPAAVDLSRLAAGGPLLVQHDADRHVGVIESARIDDDRVGRAVVRFGRGAAAEEIWQDVQDGIRRNVSVGYRIDDYDEKPMDEDDGMCVLTATRWTPLEVSLVAVPADQTVGVGRAAEFAQPSSAEPSETTTQPQEKATERITMSEATTIPANDAADKLAERQAEVKEILALGKAHNRMDDAVSAVSNGIGIDKFRDDLLKSLGARKVETTVEIGLTPKEVRKYSFVNAISALVDPSFPGAGFERECSEAVAQKRHKAARGIFVPHDVLTLGQRAMTGNYINKTTAADGGYLVGTENLAGSFIEQLYAELVSKQLGIVTLSGLVSDVTIPKRTAGATSYWLAENGDVTVSKPTFGQVSLTPKTVAAATLITRKMLVQSNPAVEQLTRDDIAMQLAEAIDTAVFEGSGSSNQPSGALTVAANSVAMGTTLTFGKLVDMQTQIAIDKALRGRLAYLVSPQIKGAAMQTLKASAAGSAMIYENGQIAGYPAFASNNLTSTTCLLANWADIILAMWGGLDLTIDTATYSLSGGIQVIAFQDVDIGVRNLNSICKGTGLSY